MKDINAVGQKMTREGCKMANSSIFLFFYAEDYIAIFSYQIIVISSQNNVRKYRTKGHEQDFRSYLDEWT